MTNATHTFIEVIKAWDLVCRYIVVPEKIRSELLKAMMGEYDRGSTLWLEQQVESEDES